MADLHHSRGEVLSDELLNGLQRPRHSQLQPVAIAILALQLLRSAQAAEGAVDHDAHPGAQRLALRHAVGGEQHRLARTHHTPDHRPQELAGAGVHSGGRFILEKTRWNEGSGEETALAASAGLCCGELSCTDQEQQTRCPQESDGCRELPAVASRVLAGWFVCMLCQVQLVQGPLHHLRDLQPHQSRSGRAATCCAHCTHLAAGNPPQVGVQSEVLPASQLFCQSVHLRTVAN